MSITVSFMGISPLSSSTSPSSWSKILDGGMSLAFWDGGGVAVSDGVAVKFGAWVVGVVVALAPPPVVGEVVPAVVAFIAAPQLNALRVVTLQDRS